MTETTQCQCGRAKLHCPRCGYGGLIGLAKLTRVVEDTTIYSYRCRKCARIFDDLMRELCSAPHVSAARTKTIVSKADKITENMTYAEKKQYLASILERRRFAQLQEPQPPEHEPTVADEIDKKE